MSRAHLGAGRACILLRMALLVVAAAFCAYIPAPALGQEAAEEAGYNPRELEKEIYQLSHIEAARCLEIMKSLGYRTTPADGPLAMSDLPLLFALSDTKADSVVGAEDTLNPTTDSSAQQRLMILYHASQLAELAALKKTLSYQIDVPSRGVLIEALVIELSEKATRELGFYYDISCPHGIFTFQADESSDTPYLKVVGKKLYEGVEANLRKFEVTLKALIDEQQAEVLSSPSVLTLDGRQARITVAQEVPIIQSTTVSGGTTTVNVSFKQVGITLNIKPRVAADGSWVTLQIQIEVSEAPLEDYLVVGGEPVAPLISSRKVETIARIKNNTPFIVGGLIRNEYGQSEARIPLLSSIPILGNLFKVRADRNEKREVIIVLTPRVIETQTAARPLLPKDTERFDFLGNRLFRDSYRLKAKDVFDLKFITDNTEIQKTFSGAREYLETRPELRNEPPFDVIAMGGVPGEETIVIRMIYEITKKLGLHNVVDVSRLIYFAPAPQNPAGFKVTFLEETLSALAGDMDVTEYLEREYPKDVLMLQYDLLQRELRQYKALGGEDASGNGLVPVASVQLEPAESREKAELMAYDYGKTDGYVRTQAAILIADPQDLERLRAAVATREVLNVNNLEAILQLGSFQVGRRIVVPEIDPSGERIFLVDDRVADLFFQSDFYYEVFQDKFRAYYEGIQKALAQ